MYKITVIDTNTNEVIVNEETNCIDCITWEIKQCGKENSTTAVAVTYCTPMEIGRTIRVFDKIKNKLLTECEEDDEYEEDDE